MSARSQARRYAGLLFALIPAILIAQSVFTYSDAKGDLSLRARDGQGELISEGYRFNLRGAVQISSKARRFNIQAAQIVATIGRGVASQSPNELRKAVATGGVKVVQTAPGRTATLQSNSATYTTQGAGAAIQVNGLVRLIDANQNKREVLTATGSKGSATLNPKSSRGIDRATLEGPVRVEMDQAGQGGSKVVFTGNRMTLVGNVVTLSGNVKASGSGASRFGNLSNVDSVTVQLNEKGELSKFSFKSGGGK